MISVLLCEWMCVYYQLYCSSVVGGINTDHSLYPTCVHVHTHTHTHTHMRACAHTHTRTHTRAQTQTHTHTCCVHMHLYVCLLPYMHTQNAHVCIRPWTYILTYAVHTTLLCISMCARVRTHMHTCTHRHTMHTHTDAHTHTHTHTHARMHTHTLQMTS